MKVEISLGYSLTRNYPWRAFPIVVVTISVLLLIFLLIVSIPFAGHETITLYVTNPNTTKPSPWSYLLPKSLRQHGITGPEPWQGHSFLTGDSAQTSQSFFDYEISAIFTPNFTEEVTTFQYYNNPFTACDVWQLILGIEPPKMAAVMTGYVSCGDAVLPVNMISTFRMGFTAENDDLVSGDTFKVNSVTVSDTEELALGFIDALSTDLQTMTFALPAVTGSNFAYISVPVYPILNDQAPVTMQQQGLVATFANGTSITDPYNTGVLGPLNTTFLNLFQAFYHAFSYDLGNQNPDNIFINRASMEATILPNAEAGTQANLLNQASPVMGYGCTWYYSCSTTSSWAEILLGQSISNLTVPTQGASPNVTVIQLVYPFPQYHLKPWASAVFAVVSQTASIFLSIWAFTIGFLAAYFARKKRHEDGRPIGNHCTCPACTASFAAEAKAEALAEAEAADEESQTKRPISNGGTEVIHTLEFNNDAKEKPEIEEIKA